MSNEYYVQEHIRPTMRYYEVRGPNPDWCPDDPRSRMTILVSGHRSRDWAECKAQRLNAMHSRLLDAQEPAEKDQIQYSRYDTGWLPEMHEDWQPLAQPLTGD